MFCLLESGRFTQVLLLYVEGPKGYTEVSSGGPRQKFLVSIGSAILSTFIKLPFVIKIFVLSIFEWPFYTGFTVHRKGW